MLEILDLHLELDKSAYRKQMAAVGAELALLQRAAREIGLPVLMVFEGWDGAGKGDSIARLVESMDPRGFKVRTPRGPSEDEALRPMLWRYWRRMPGRGDTTIFDRSWYHDLTVARLDGEIDRSRWERAVRDVKDFERQLTDDGTVIVKFWLHVSKKEIRRRIRAWESEPYQKWRTRGPLGKGARRYEDVVTIVEETLALSNTHNAPWVLVESEDDRYRDVKVLTEAAGALRRALMDRGVPPPDQARVPSRVPRAGRPRRHADPLVRPPSIPGDSPLARVDLSLRLPRKRYERELREAQSALRELEFACYTHRVPAVVVFEGWDAAGKGGAIKRLTQRLDPRGYEVIPVAAPRGDEASHHYLARFWEHVPKAGHLAIFDRSWYGRVLVERVEGLCGEAQWRRAYEEINEFEQSLVDAGAVLVKLFLHIGPGEQLRRFRAREADPSKRPKIGEEDWRNRARWPEYLAAVSDMLRRTSTPYAPWTIVEAEDKLHARVKVVRTVERAIAERLSRLS